MICEQLHGDGVDQRRDQRVDSRHFDGGKASFACLLYALGIGYQDYLAATRAMCSI